MRKHKKIVPGLVTLTLAFITSIPVFAASNVTVSLPANQTWSSSYSDSRSGSYSTVSANCDSVYPSSGTDNYEKIQVRIRNSSGTVIMNSDYVTLSETASSSTYIDIKEGYLNTTTVYFQFRGNTSAAASAVVDYSGR